MELPELDSPQRTATWASERPPLDRADTHQSVRERPALGGYPLLARLMDEASGQAIFRRFGSLNARNLLYYQVEILLLERELDEIERQHRLGSVGRDYQKFAEYLVKAAWDPANAEHGETETAHHNCVRRLRSMISGYNSALLDMHRLYQLPEPAQTDVLRLREFLEDEKHDGVGPFTSALEASIWAVHLETKSSDEGSIWKKYHPVEQDLVVLNSLPNEQSKAMRVLRYNLLERFSTSRLFRRFRPATNEFGKHSYSGTMLESIVDSTIVVLSCVLPTASIFALHFIRLQIWRLAFIAIWAMVFSLCLKFFTEATRVQIFSASLAMAAVQVVFVSAGPGGNGTSGV